MMDEWLKIFAKHKMKSVRWSRVKTPSTRHPTTRCQPFSAGLRHLGFSNWQLTAGLKPRSCWTCLAVLCLTGALTLLWMTVKAVKGIWSNWSSGQGDARALTYSLEFPIHLTCRFFLWDCHHVGPCVYIYVYIHLGFFFLFWYQTMIECNVISSQWLVHGFKSGRARQPSHTRRVASKPRNTEQPVKGELLLTVLIISHGNHFIRQFVSCPNKRFTVY